MNRLLLCMLFSQPVFAAELFSSEKYSFTLETVVSGLRHPWAMDFLPDGRILITEKPGWLRIIKDGKLMPEEISGLPKIWDTKQGGLMDIALDPDYKKNQTIYLTYSGLGDLGIGTEVARARLVGKRLEDLQIIFKLSPKGGGAYHFGSRLLFDDDGTLLISMGDRGEKTRAQDLADHAGSLVRINKDGSVPGDNPFVNQPDVKPEIYTYGNRNIQGIAKHPVTGDIWTVEHGPQGGDELNVMKSGLNYGWPVITYGRNYVTGTPIGEGVEKVGMAQPVHYWIPSIATSSLLFYTGDAFPEWRNNAFVSSLVFGQLARLELKDNELVKEERLLGGEGVPVRIREVQQGPDGFIYIITDERNGKLMCLKPAK